MLKRVICLAAVGALVLGAGELEKYSFHAKVKKGDVRVFTFSHETVSDITTVIDGNTRRLQLLDRHDVKAKTTVLEARNGTATQMRVEADPSCSDTMGTDGAPPHKSSSEVAGKSIAFARADDGTITNDYNDESAGPDVVELNNCISPDQDFFPDGEVAVGDTWDISVVAAQEWKLQPQEKMVANCHLDWVKEIGGKKMAQIRCSLTVILHRDWDPRENMVHRISMTMLVDMATDQIVRGVNVDVFKCSTPKDDPIKVSGGGTDRFTGCFAGYEGDEFVPATRPSDDGE